MVGQDPKVGSRKQVVIPINDLQVAKISRPSEAFTGEMAAAHLGRCMEARCAAVDYFPTELHHVCVVPQVAE
ncbi:hypothetical protein ACLOJK_001906 [Asimina triloba]